MRAGYETCGDCDGSGKCPGCEGTGRFQGATCLVCGGDKLCLRCRGQGEIPAQTPRAPAIAGKPPGALVPRSVAEEHLYVRLHPHDCGEERLDAPARLETRGEELYSVIEGACPRCGRKRRFEFKLAGELAPGGLVPYGGAEPSRILDPGEYLAASERFASAGDPTSMVQAIAALEEVLKFIPPGQGSVPATACWSERSAEILRTQPGQFDRARLEARLAAYRQRVGEPRARRIEWTLSGDVEEPWEARVDGQLWRVRVNDFPEEPHVYTLLIDGRPAQDFDEWPATWTRPSLRGQGEAGGQEARDAKDAVERRELEVELEKFERTKHIPPSKRVK